MLKCVGDVRKEVTGDETPVHRVLDVSDPGGLEQRALPFVLSFNNLTYNVKVRRKMAVPAVFQSRSRMSAAAAGGETVVARTKTLLNDISGEARDGELMAVLGASGSGKSTLIDALANRIAKESLKGSITLNGEPLDSRLLKVISAYVMQDDLLYPMLTVEETLMFAAEFRLPRTLSKAKKKMRVQALIDQLGLRNAAKTVIGDEGHRGVSGGERRRVSIGIDIIHDPIILFLDEPTSGLDSTSAFMVVKVLQRIAQSGSIVIMSIHQPSYRIVGLLDRVLFLSRGQTVYSGSPSNLPHFFSDFGHPIPDSENKTEFALDLIRELEGSPGGTKSLVEFNRTWQNTKRNATGIHEPNPVHGLSLKEAISASISRGKLVPGATNDASTTSLVPTFANPFWTEMVVLSKRSFKNSSRMPALFGTRGFFMNRDRIPPYWIWFHYLSLVKYPYEAVLQNEFDDPTKCFVRGIQMFDNSPLSAVSTPLKERLLSTMSSTLNIKITANTCVTTGADILAQQGVTDLSKWGCLWELNKTENGTLPFSTLPLPKSNSVFSPSSFKPHAHPYLRFVVRATGDDSASETEEEADAQTTADADDFDSRLSNVRIRYRSGLGKKAERRKARQGKKVASESGSGIYLPPVPLREAVSEGLSVEFGFSPFSERVNGRIAILGITALVLVELATGQGVIKYHTPAIILIQVYFVAAVAALYVKYEKEKVSVWPSEK
nr:ABC transporter G family member 6-like [Ipomoea batatas]